MIKTYLLHILYNSRGGGSDRSTVSQDDKYVEEAYDLSERDNEEQ
jgi:hypothetical protein